LWHILALFLSVVGSRFYPSGRNFGPATSTCHGDEKDFRIFLHANYESTIGRPVNQKDGVYSFFTSFLEKEKKKLLASIFICWLMATTTT
jgi:hypothetical protein